MAAGEIPGLGRVRGHPRLGGLGPVGGKVTDPGLPVGPLARGHARPPFLRGLIGAVSPRLPDLVFVLPMVEAIEHLLCHERLTCLHSLDRRGDGSDLPRQARSLASERAHMFIEGGDRVRGALEHLGDPGQRQSEVPQQQDPLEADEARLVVVPVAVRRPR
ncbi:Uncharacterised protein [Mycobacteroides abscessus subsp. abscessus]|nr:Uncharacterised protein [Mycobacteroides abscessus subsp. abscessus]